MSKQRAVILVSGGLNSAVMTALTREDHDLCAMHARYGHRAADHEFDLFTKQADHFLIKERMTIDFPWFESIGGSARVNRKKQIEDVLSLSEAESNCHTPGLIGSLLSAAFNWAADLGAQTIFLGTCENLGPPGPRTSSVFPDHSRDYLQLAQQSMQIAFPWRRITIEAPLLDMSRAEIVKLGKRLKVPFELTWSCLSNGTKPCGGCLGCATRNRGFLDATVPDPLLLKSSLSSGARTSSASELIQA